MTTALDMADGTLPDVVAAVRRHWIGSGKPSVGRLSVAVTGRGPAQVEVDVEPGEQALVCARLLFWHHTLAEAWVYVEPATSSTGPSVRMSGMLVDGTRAVVVGHFDIGAVEGPLVGSGAVEWLRGQVSGIGPQWPLELGGALPG
ncbi:hypothetical protein [Actinokineospora diospyrosa]|uniref:Polyketide cyclase/dehydrase/lipid transport protein n=1 Tax=Actinokineospora diospyrosa TaxID=103728 RepID=A0ABT1ILM8_9PSEU|nr:hypothetical protein [Actinokineospora diospyrosa]MCP2273563.1 hypothetical protein [Actinokineospora diospyrosa]